MAIALKSSLVLQRPRRLAIEDLFAEAAETPIRTEKFVNCPRPNGKVRHRASGTLAAPGM
jgi:hypothetical protein